MGVVGFGQAEVAEAFWGVDSAFERTEEADLEGVAIGSAGENFKDFLNFAALGEISCFDSVREKKFTIFLEARFLGSFMDTVDGGSVFLVEVAGDGLIGEEHKLFDELVRFVGGLFFDSGGAALGVEDDAEFRKIEVEGSGFEAAAAQGGGKVPGALEEAVEIVLGGPAEASEGFGVGEAVAGKNDGAGEAGGAGFAIGAEVNESGAGEALLVGAQRAESVGEAWGKHGDDAIDEVDAVGPFASFLVEGGAGQDVVGNIGDMNSEFDVTSGKFAEGNGVVEIAGGIGVDGDDQFGAEVFAADGVGGEFDGREGGGFGKGIGRESGGEIEFSDDGENVDSGVGGSAEAFEDDAFGIGLAVFPVDEFSNDFIAGFGGGGAGGAWSGDVEVMEEARVVGDDDKETGGFLKSAHDLGGLPLEDTNDATAEAIGGGGATTASGGGACATIDACDDEIAVKGGAGFFRGDVEVGGAVWGDDEGEAFGVELDGAGNEVGRVGGNPLISADARDSVSFFELGEGKGEGAGGDAEAAAEGSRVEGSGFLALEEGKNAVG